MRLYKQVYPLLRPRPRRPKFDDFYDFLVDQADELEDVFKAGDDNALWDALAIARGIPAPCAWADAEFGRRLDAMRRTLDIKSFKGRGSTGRGSPIRFGRDGIWKAYVHVAYAVARQADYNKTSALEVAARILEKVDSGQHGYETGSLEHHLKTRRSSVMELLTIEHTAEITHCCCSWFAYIQKNEPHTLPPDANTQTTR